VGPIARCYESISLVRTEWLWPMVTLGNVAMIARAQIGDLD